jgi:hypothetical protein
MEVLIVAYNLYDLQIKGDEVKKRLDLLAQISISGDMVAPYSDLQSLRDALSDLQELISGIVDADKKIVYLNSGSISDYYTF